jgi:hypothetical protein
MARILLGDSELEVDESFEEVCARIFNADIQPPMLGERRLLPKGWLILRATELQDEVYVQRSAIAYVRKD